jgi:hypothetical protein
LKAALLIIIENQIETKIFEKKIWHYGKSSSVEGFDAVEVLEED